MCDNTIYIKYGERLHAKIHFCNNVLINICGVGEHSLYSLYISLVKLIMLDECNCQKKHIYDVLLSKCILDIDTTWKMKFEIYINRYPFSCPIIYETLARSGWMFIVKGFPFYIQFDSRFLWILKHATSISLYGTDNVSVSYTHLRAHET